MIDIGTVRGASVTTNRDGEDPVRLLQVELTNGDDLQEVEQIRTSGDDAAPRPGSRVIVLSLGAAYRVGIISDDGSDPVVDPGSREIYAYDGNGNRTAKIYLQGGGGVTIETGTSAVDVSPGGVVTVTADKLVLNSEIDAAGKASAIDLLWTTLDTVFRSWVPPPTPDSGAALKAAYMAAFPAPPSSVASAKLKLDG